MLLPCAATSRTSGILPVTGPSNMFTYVLVALVQWIFRKARPAPRLRSERGRLRGFGLGARPAPRLRSWSEAAAALVLEWHSGRSEKFPCPRDSGVVCLTQQPLTGATACWCVKHTNPSSAQVSASTSFFLWGRTGGRLIFFLGRIPTLEASTSAGWRGTSASEKVVCETYPPNHADYHEGHGPKRKWPLQDLAGLQ